ncbi:hypothetical protein [Limibacterium fermenti]|uniref:hypothetical protein n=1 Tax=Limibacterium fermenti TaxID=3229863 RepID=UPI003A6FACE6
METKIEEFNNALCDVRKAYRLIYSYQSRMLDLAYFIKSKLDFPSFLGFKHYSEPIVQKRNGELRIWNNMWAWDFLYSYMFEYDFENVLMENGEEYGLSIIQYSDTGFFESNGIDRLDIDSFAKEDESGSKLLFILEVKPKKKEWIWNIEELIYNKEYATMQHTRSVLNSEKGNIQILYSFPLDRFLNEQTSIDALEEFINFCHENNIMELSII